MIKRFLLAVLIVSIVSCGDDDDGDGVTVIDPETLSDQIVVDDAAIVEFLQTHFYEVVDDTNGQFEVRIDTIAGENSGEEPLMNQVSSEVINVSSFHFNLGDDEVDVPHTLYYLILREREDETPRPTIADSTLVRYEGQLLDGTQFDGSTTYLWQQLPFTLRGYANGVAKLKAGTNLIHNGDGTSYYTDSEIGLFFIPSGLAYFLGGGPTNTLPSYSNLIFQIELGSFVENTDSDNDGIPSILEDLNQNGYLPDDNTDRESEESAFSQLIANFQDIDDDDDGVLTRTEISDANGDIIIPYPDSNNDGTPDYLDPDIQWDESGDDN